MRKGLNLIRIDIIIFQILIMLYLFIYGKGINSKVIVLGFLIIAINLIYILFELDKIYQMITDSDTEIKHKATLCEEKLKSLEHIKKIKHLFENDTQEDLIAYIEKSQKEYHMETLPEYELEILNIIIQRYTFICKNESIDFEYDIQTNVKLLMDAVGFTGEHLCTVLGNLLDNAIDVLKNNVDEKKLKVIIVGNGYKVSIKVINNGEKISDKVKDKIFNYGFSTKEEGRGAGLFIVYKLVDKIGAVLNVNSDSKNTSFEINFEVK